MGRSKTFVAVVWGPTRPFGGPEWFGNTAELAVWGRVAVCGILGESRIVVSVQLRAVEKDKVQPTCSQFAFRERSG